MVCRAACVLAILLGAAGSASAHGGPEALGSIHFRQDHEQDIVSYTTFGLLLSHDGGTTWQWMCEADLGYMWPFQPSLAYSPSGAVFSTTLAAPRVMRDGCTFDGLGAGMISEIELGPDHAMFMTSVDLTDASVYKSTDDGATFPIAATAGLPGDWYSSIMVAPTDASRVYLSGYRIECETLPDLSQHCWRAYQLYRSDDGGATYAPINAAPIETAINSSMTFVAIEPGAPDTVYLHVDLLSDEGRSALWRSTDAGATWTEVFRDEAPSSVLLRANGDLVAGTTNTDAYVSHDRGDHWTKLAGAPHINCLVENSAGEVWACTRAYDSIELGPGDKAAIMKTTDLASWTKVLRFEDITAPVACAAGTTQHDVCADPNPNQTWCQIVTKLQITSYLVQCTPMTAEPPDAGVGPGGPGDDPPGCCDTGSSSGGLSSFLLGAAVLAAGRRRRRR